jgi:type II secretion system protein N
MSAATAGAASRDAIRERWQRLGGPRTAAARDVVRRMTLGAATPIASYALYTAVLFLVFFAATFPHELLVRRALDAAASAPVAVEVRGVHLGWTLAYTIDELRLLRRDGDPALPLLTAARVRVAPSWLGLLRGRPFPLGLRSDLYGGTLDATVDLRPDAFAVRAALANIDVARYAGLRLFVDGTLQGRVDGTIDLAGNAAKPTTTTGQVELRAADLAFEGGKVLGFVVPDLHFGELRLGGTIKGGRLDLGDLNARGREVTVAGTGNLILQHPLAASLLNLDVTMTPAADLPDNLRLLLNMVPGEAVANGGRHLRLFGSIAQPRVQ